MKEKNRRREGPVKNGIKTNPQAENGNGHHDRYDSPYQVVLSIRFMVLSLVLSVLLAYALGSYYRVYAESKKQEAGGGKSQRTTTTLPKPTLPKGKIAPDTQYSSRHFDVDGATQSGALLDTSTQQAADDEWIVTADGNVKPAGKENNSKDEADHSDIHQPTGQHLLVDIENVDGAFLDSEERLAQATLDLVNKSGLTMLSYHCHGLEPMGVSCVGVLLESHVSFHTWPSEGVITLDIFTCGPNALLPLVPMIQTLFGVPKTPSQEGQTVEEPRILWAHKRRGFRPEDVRFNPESVDLDHFLLGWRELEKKTQVAYVETDLQTIEIYDLINPFFHEAEQYEKSLLDDGSYESQHPELFQPDRVLYLDGVMQSRLKGEAAYHEALVHPALLSHDNPKRVAIIGGGEGATLREVLKHNTVEKVTMVEIDEDMVNTSREYLPQWSDCSNIVGGAVSCFDDPRTEVFYTDAMAWFLERYSDAEKVAEADKYDVIIMDALDPNAVIEFSDVLYKHDKLVEALYNALDSEGILVAQVGEDETLEKPMRSHVHLGQLETFITNIEQVGFEAIKEYSEVHGGFLAVWKFLIAFKDYSCKASWYANEAEIDLEIWRRSMPTVSGESPFRYFDGATMMVYQYPSRISEEVFCRTDPTPALCEDGHGFNPELQNAPISAFEVKPSKIPNAGRGVFFKEAFPKGTYIAIDEGVNDMMILPFALSIIESMLGTEMKDSWKVFPYYIYGYGFYSDFYGMTSSSVDPGILTFINHGCKGTNTMGLTSVTEMTADPNEMAEELFHDPVESTVYSPFVDRNHWVHLNAHDFTTRDVVAGDELTDNYLSYIREEKWATALADYKAQCVSQAKGAVTSYEQTE